MTTHMIWGLIGFNLALLFVWIFHILRTKGVGYFWTHPVLACIILVISLYVLESVFSDLSELQVTLDWTLALWAGIPLCLLAMLFFAKAVHTFKSTKE